MKTLKTMFAALAISMIAAPAFAEVPASAQRGLEKAELHKRVKEKRERDGGSDKADREEKGAKAKGGKGKADKGKADKGKADKGKANKGGQDAKEKGHAKRDTRDVEDAKGKPSTERPDKREDRDVAAKRNENSAKGLDRAQREDRKHLRRLASIERIAEIAKRTGNTRLLERAEMIRIKEDARFGRAVNRLATSGRPDVGSPVGD